MTYDVPLPRVLDASGNELRRLNVIDASVTLSLVPLSTAQITLPVFDDLSMREWVQMYTSQGSAGIFRVRAPGQNYRQETKQYTLDHGIAELGDYIIKGELELNAAANSVITSIFSHYAGSMWRLGTVAATDTVEYTGDYEDVLTALLSVMDQLPQYMLQFDQTVRPWVVSVVRKPETISGEGRLARNIISARISEDDSNLCTRLYGPGLGTNGYIDADTISTYGVVERHMDKDDEMEQSKFAADCQKYLDQHKIPLLSVSLDLYDLEQITGELLDGISIGQMYRIALPEYDTVIEEPVVSLAWRSVYGNPGLINVTLAHEEMTMSSAFHTVAGAMGGLESGSSLAKTNQKIVKEEVKLRETQTYITGLERRVDEAYVEIDAQGVEIGATRESVNVLSGRVTTNEATLTVQANQIQSKVSQTEFTALGERVSTAESSITQTAEQIALKVSKGDVSTQLSVECGNVSVSGGNLVVSGYITSQGLITTMGNFSSNISTSGTVSATGFTGANITLQGNTLTSNLLSIANKTFYVAADGPVTLFHYHAISTSVSGGTVTITQGADQDTPGTATFNIADTQYYKDGVASAKNDRSVKSSSFLLTNVTEYPSANMIAFNVEAIANDGTIYTSNLQSVTYTGESYTAKSYTRYGALAYYDDSQDKYVSAGYGYWFLSNSNTLYEKS